MMKKWLTVLLCVLAVLMLVACTPDGPGDPSGPNDPDEPTLTGDYFDLSATTEYVVVVSEYASNEEEQAARIIRNAIEAAHGHKPKISSDWLTGAPSAEEVAARVELLVGEVDRPESESVLAEMTVNGYTVCVKGNKLVVLGASDEMTLQAAQYFASQILYDGQGNAVKRLEENYMYVKSFDPVLVDTVYETDDLVVAHAIVTEFPYLADPTGQKDSTAAIQAALDDVYAQGGGTVFLPVGEYLVSDTVTVPRGCLLKGDWQDPDTAEMLEYGTVILAKTPVLDEAYLADRTRSPLISLDTWSSVEGLTVYYPEQNMDDVVKYGYTIYCHAPSTTSISNITLINSYRGVGIDVHAQESHELVQLNGIHMTVLEMGFEEYHSTDVGNVDDVRITPAYWMNAAKGYACDDADALAEYCKANTIGMQINGLDDTHLSNLYMEGLRTAVYMPTGHSTHDYWGVIYDVIIENCVNGFVIESLNGYGGAAIAKATIEADQAAIYSSAKTGALKLCDVTAVSGDIVAVGNARIYEDFIDVSDYEIVHATYEKPASKLYVAPILMYSKTKQDVTSLIQTTLNEAAATGGVVYLPAGVYSVYGTLSVPEGVELRGSVPIFMCDAQSGSQGIQGTVLLTYVERGATITLADKAGVNGLRIFCGVYSPIDARDLLAVDDRLTQTQVAIKGEGEGVYAHNVVITGTFNGMDFTDCDNHSIKHAFGAVYRHFIIAGGKDGVIEQCLTNQHFFNRQHFLANGYMDSKYYTGWSMTTEMTHLLRDEVRRAFGIMVYLVDAENETVSNIFTYGPHTLVLCDNSSATLINTSSDFHGMGPMFDVLNNSDVVAVNALRSANESLRCDETSDFKLINRISISRFNEPSFDSADGNVDEVEYTVKDKTMINDGSVKVGSTTLYTGNKYSKTGNTSLYHAASPSDSIDATLYSQTFTPINIDPYMNEDGYLHMWVYVEDMTTSIWTGQILLKGTYGSLMWSNICYITHNGWNELWLPLTGATGTVSGTVNSLSITDKRSVKKEHSDFYFDDIYLCIAESDDADANETVDAYEVAPVPELNIPALPPAITEDGKITLISCDSLYNNKARSTLAYVIGDPEFVKEGTGSWKMSRFGHLSYEVTFDSVNLSKYMKNGYLHLWIYAENAGTLDGAFELTSSGKCDKQEISWHAKKHLIKNGWNELLLPLSKPDSSTGDFAPRSANYFRFYLTSSGNVTIYIDDVSIIGGSAEDLGPEEITEDSETFSFTVGTGAEGVYLENSNSHLNKSVRFADGTAAFAYVYHVRDFSKLQAVRWDATTSGQMKVSVSTDGKNWVDAYEYVGSAADSGLGRANRTYNLTDFITEKRATSGEIYVKISDAYPETGFGGAVAIEAPVEMTLYYVPVDTSEWGSEESGDSTPTAPPVEDEIPDVLPATETHVFHANQPAELSYLVSTGNTSSVLGGNRFSDATRSFTYAYTIYDFSKVRELSWTATVGQQLHILVSTDNVNFTDVYRYTNEEERGIAFEQRTYDLLPLIDRTTSSIKLYIKIADSQTENGWGGAIRCDAPITLKVAYEGGEGDVLKGESEIDESETPVDPDNMPVADTPRPDGEVDKKLMLHGCETLNSARTDWVAVYLNTDPIYVKEGSASIKRQNAMDSQWFALQLEKTDISDFMENGYLHLWVYVTKYNLGAQGGQIEISSSGHADDNELHWNVADYITGTGWNEVFVPLSAGIENKEGAPFDPTGLNFVRIFAPTTDGKYNTVYIDDIYFCTMK